jgi:predicted transposase/invertase (TIGR01784 family)
MDSVVTPHDHFFRSAMADSRVAKEFFAHHLPDFIKQRINWNKLRPCSTIFVDKELKLSASDILYQTTIAKKTGYIYLLAEHQSSPDKLMPFRIWQYILAIQAGHLKQTKSKLLPLVYPLVFYHGKKPYLYSTDIRDIIAAPRDLIDQVLFKPFQLIDTHTLGDEKLKQLQWAGVMEFMMKHIFARDFLPYLKQALSILRELEKNGENDYIITVLRYAMEAGETGTPAQLVKVVKAELSDTERNFMTTAEWLRKQGREEGMEKGKREGKIESLRQVANNLLQKGKDLAFIAEVTGLSLDEIQQI